MKHLIMLEVMKKDRRSNVPVEGHEHGRARHDVRRPLAQADAASKFAGQVKGLAHGLFLGNGQALGIDEAERAFDIMTNGDATPAQMGAFLMGLKVRGETAEELAGGARVLRAKVQGGNAGWDVVQVESDELEIGCEEAVIAFFGVDDEVAGVEQLRHHRAAGAAVGRGGHGSSPRSSSSRPLGAGPPGVAQRLGVARAFLNPASDALAPNLLPPEAIAHGISLNSMSWQIANIVGPVPGHGPMDLRPRPTLAPLVFTALGNVDLDGDGRAAGGAQLADGRIGGRAVRWLGLVRSLARGRFDGTARSRLLVRPFHSGIHFMVVGGSRCTFWEVYRDF